MQSQTHAITPFEMMNLRVSYFGFAWNNAGDGNGIQIPFLLASVVGIFSAPE